MEQLLIPAADAMPIPAPVWLLKFLLLFTFFLHLIPMNIILGGSFTTLFADWFGRKKNSEYHLALARSFSKAIPTAMAFTITLGIAPLLFLQVLYGQLFYASSILMGWPWLLIVGLIITAYYSFYTYSYRWEKMHAARLAVIALGAVLVGIVAMIYRNNMTLMLLPETFRATYFQDPAGTLMSVDEATSLPRFLHFFIGAFAVTGLFIVVYALRKLSSSEAYGRWALRFGVILFASATLVEMAVGIWYLVALPKDVMMLFMGGSILGTASLGLGILLPFGSMMLLMMSMKAERPAKQAWGGIGLLVLTLVFMVIMRDIVRDGYLAGTFDVYDRVTDPQWGVIAIFTVLLLLGLGVVGYMLKLVMDAMKGPKPN